MKNKFTIAIASIIHLVLFSGLAVAQIIPDFLVNEQGSPDGSEQANPRIAGYGNGNYVVAWQDERSGYNTDIFAQIYANGGTPQGANFKVNDDNGYAAQYIPFVAAGPQMNFIIVWIDNRETGEWDVFAQRFSNDGSPVGSNFKVNDDAGDVEHEYPTVAVDSLGNFVIAWADERNGHFDIYAQRYSSEGVASGSNFKVNDDTGEALHYWPHCAGMKDGSFVVAWVDERNSGNYDIFAQCYSPDGTALGANFQVNSDAGDAFQLRPEIATDEEGGFVIVWEDNRNSEWDIFVQRFQQNGVPIGDNFVVEGNPAGSGQRNAGISGDPEGNFVISWEDDRNDYSDVYARQYSYNGNPVGECFKVNNDTTNSQQNSSGVFRADNGDFLIVWQDYRTSWNGDIYSQSYLNDGTLVEDNLKINDDTGSENQLMPSMAVDGNGTMIFAWVDERNNNPAIYAQRFSADGAALGDNFEVNDDSGAGIYDLQPSVAANENGNFVIAWADFRNGYCFDIYAQRFAPDGTPQGENFLVSNSGACMHYTPVVAFKEDDNFIIVWADADEGGFDKAGLSGIFKNKPEGSYKDDQNKGNEPDVYAQLYLNDGTPVGDNFIVNEEPGYTFQVNPTVAVDANGNFTIGWEDDRNGPWHIYLQRFLYDGTPIGVNYQAEDDTYPDHQIYPSLSMNGEGNFSVAWMDNRNGNYDIFCRRFSVDGLPVGESFQVNDDTGTAYQSVPRVSVQSDGRFVVSWTDNRNGTDDVFAQRFSGNGEPYSGNFGIPGADALEQLYPCLVLDNDMIYSSWQDNREGQTGFDILANVLEWDTVSGIDPGLYSVTPEDFGVCQNFPNPFRDVTAISIEMDEAGSVQLYIYDLLGKPVRSEKFEFSERGIRNIEISGNGLPGGIYLYRLIAGGKVSPARKMTLLK
jgi:hypothetical protein